MSGHAVGVVIGGFGLFDASVYPVADPQHNGGQCRCQQAADEDGELDVIVSFAAGTKIGTQWTQARRATPAPARRTSSDPHPAPLGSTKPTNRRRREFRSAYPQPAEHDADRDRIEQRSAQTRERSCAVRKIQNTSNPRARSVMQAECRLDLDMRAPVHVC
jgi:hypothetical protein